jgi:hypothetical protein
LDNLSVLQALKTEDSVPDALILAWYAAGNKSLLAAKCFVETVLQCYQKGYTVDDLEVKSAHEPCHAYLPVHARQPPSQPANSHASAIFVLLLHL